MFANSRAKMHNNGIKVREITKNNFLSQCQPFFHSDLTPSIPPSLKVKENPAINGPNDPITNKRLYKGMCGIKRNEESKLGSHNSHENVNVISRYLPKLLSNWFK